MESLQDPKFGFTKEEYYYHIKHIEDSNFGHFCAIGILCPSSWQIRHGNQPFDDMENKYSQEEEIFALL
jgi:hypothetical protein